LRRKKLSGFFPSLFLICWNLDGKHFGVSCDFWMADWLYFEVLIFDRGFDRCEFLNSVFVW
jgi:hypothetical protein